MEKKYTIELTEEQLKLISMCVEDCHRFSAGQTQMFNTAMCLAHDKRKEVRTALDSIKLPQYDWAGNGCEDNSHRRFIAQTYGIYREIKHFFAIKSDDGSYSVYKNPTLTCDDSIPLPTIRTAEEGKTTDPVLRAMVAQCRADVARAASWWQTQTVSVINYQDIINFRKAMGAGLGEKNAIAVMDAMADWLDSRRAVPAPYSIKAFTRAVRYAARQLTKSIKL